MTDTADARVIALSKELQATIRRHVDEANGKVEVFDLLTMPIIAASEALSGAIGSVCATVANARDMDDHALRDLVDVQIAHAQALLAAGTATIVATAQKAIATERAKAA